MKMEKAQMIHFKLVGHMKQRKPMLTVKRLLMMGKAPSKDSLGWPMNVSRRDKSNKTTSSIILLSINTRQIHPPTRIMPTV
mmetsp:Transcript_7273/g.15365  ORF Transcript_7273/g.15365 Transcript_7273/m.15365 type:complete len:81 (-) Transcript_7273:17-259(-)